MRVRRSGNRRIQTLKSARLERSVASTRGEWEWAIDGEEPDLRRLADTPFARIVSTRAAHGLQPVFESDVRRSVRLLRLDGGTVAEAAIDEGRVAAGSAREDLRELELELKAGSRAPLLRLALELHTAVPVTIGAESKAQRGFRLRTGEPPAPVKAEPPSLSPRAQAIDAAARILDAGLGALVANQPAVAAGQAEGVHQFRIGIRRLRTALAMFAPLLEPTAAARFEAELKRLGQVFGTARDWDVFCTQILREAEDDPAVRGWAELLHMPAEAERAAAHRAVEEELRRPALTGLMLGMAAWLATDAGSSPATGDDDLRRPFGKIAPDLLDRMARRVAKRGGRVRRRSAEELHELRKAMKKLRYSVEYVAPIYHSGRVKRYHKALKRTLKTLGAAQDAIVAVTLAERLCQGEQRSDYVASAGALARWARAYRATALRGLPKRWTAFAAAEAFWR